MVIHGLENAGPDCNQIEDLRKTEARENVKKELLQKANRILAGEKIRRIYFDEFLFQ
jgi:flagellar basal body-associated protein FliL